MVKIPEENISNITLGTAYEINKDLVEKYEKELTDTQLDDKKDNIIDFLEDTENTYYMLLCNDRKDYTVFNLKNEKAKSEMEATEVLVDECLKNRGIIKSIELTKNKDAIEIWLSIDGESYCYYFFPYDNAVIEC